MRTTIDRIKCQIKYTYTWKSKLDTVYTSVDRTTFETSRRIEKLLRSEKIFAKNFAPCLILHGLTLLFDRVVLDRITERIGNRKFSRERWKKIIRKRSLFFRGDATFSARKFGLRLITHGLELLSVVHRPNVHASTKHRNTELLPLSNYLVNC